MRSRLKCSHEARYKWSENVDATLVGFLFTAFVRGHCISCAEKEGGKKVE